MGNEGQAYGEGEGVMNSETIAASFLASWAVQDVEMTAMHMHKNIIYKIHVPITIRPFGGVRHGVDECREAMFALLKDFDYLVYEPTIVNAIGNVVRAQIRFVCRHRHTGCVLEGTRRLVIRVRDDLVDRVDSYHDARLIETFLRLTEQQPTSEPSMPLPRWLRQTEGSGSNND